MGGGRSQVWYAHLFYIQVAGEANEEQLLESLRRYTHRAKYAESTVVCLYYILLANKEPRLDIIKVRFCVSNLQEWD